MLKRITFTGVEDSIEVGDLVNISRSHRYVEWGVLFPSKARGRWASHEFVRDLVAASAFEREPLNLAAHICEPLCAEILARRLELCDIIGSTLAFQRVQLNTHGVVHHLHHEWAWPLVFDHREIILQLDGVTSQRMIETTPKRMEGVFSGLHDLSHGNGVLPAAWPVAVSGLRWTGYAGGLGPHNLAEQLPKIQAACGTADYWIDMETHVRTDGLIDLDKVAKCIEIAAPFIGSKS